MPCNCDGYSEPRPMNVTEEYISLSRHHLVLEKETEELRKIVKEYYKKIIEMQKECTLNHVKTLSPIPPETTTWRNVTYRDQEGKFPTDICKHLDWLSETDYNFSKPWKYDIKCKYCGSIDIVCKVINGNDRYVLCREHSLENK